MARIPENIDERKQFNDTVRLFGGDPLCAVEKALGIWSVVSPKHGSYSQQCAIMANEVSMARERRDAIAASLRRLTAAVRQAGDISEWPVCGEGDAVGDELAAALVEAEWLAG